MADLKTNYVDDVLDTTKNQLRKYQQIQNDDGTVSFFDVTEYTQVGTSFGAKDINDTNAAINDVNRNLKLPTVYNGITPKNGYTLSFNNSFELGDYIFFNLTINGSISTSWITIAELQDNIFFSGGVGELQGTNNLARVEIKTNTITVQGLVAGGGVSINMVCKKNP